MTFLRRKGLSQILRQLFPRPCSLFKVRALAQGNVILRAICSTTHPNFGKLQSSQSSSEINPYGFDSLLLTGPSPEEIELNKRILRIKSVLGQLKVFENFRNSPHMNQFNRATVLCCIARSIENDSKQSVALELKQDNQGSNTALLFKELLDSILENMAFSRPFNLAHIVWALGKLHIDHPLFDICEFAILNSGIKVFTNDSISQIATGVSSRNRSGSLILREIEKGILSGEIEIASFEDKDFAGILHSFARAAQGSVELFEHLLEVCLQKDFSKQGFQELATFVWSFAKKGVTSEKLGKLVKGEIVERGTSDLTSRELLMILWAYAMNNESGNVLFALFDKELLRRGVGQFETAELVQIVWSYTKRKMERARVFDLVEEEISYRGVSGLKAHELCLILWSFVKAKRPSNMFYKAITKEFLTRNMAEFSDIDLCQLACSFGKSVAWNNEVFDSIQKEVFARTSSDPFPIFSLIVFLRGFVEAKRANRTFVDQMEIMMLDSDFSKLDAAGMVELLALLNKIRLKSPILFDTIERKIFSIEKTEFNSSQARKIDKCFRSANEGSQQLYDLLRSIID